jgi:G3E family GTPase
LAEIDHQLECLPYRQAQDPAAVLVKAIQEQWAEPAEYRKGKEAEEKKQQAEEENRRRAEAESEQQQHDEERARRIAAFKAQLSAEELEELFEEALQDWSPAMQNLYREKGLEASISQSLVDNWIGERYLKEGTE